MAKRTDTDPRKPQVSHGYPWLFTLTAISLALGIGIICLELGEYDFKAEAPAVTATKVAPIPAWDRPARGAAPKPAPPVNNPMQPMDDK
jgi:hypothetical protein